MSLYVEGKISIQIDGKFAQFLADYLAQSNTFVHLLVFIVFSEYSSQPVVSPLYASSTPVDSRKSL